MNAGTLVLTFALLRRRLVAVTVRGASMEPTFRDGDRVLVHRHRPLSTGQVVVVEGPGLSGEWAEPPVGRTGAVSDRRWIIKRIAAVPGEPVPGLPSLQGQRMPPGSLFLLGDNPNASLDSRHTGYFPTERVLGAVLRTCRPMPATKLGVRQ